jgi:hypothetical protein
MTLRIEIAADQALPLETPGNCLVLEASLVPGASLNSPSEVAILLTVNDGQPEVPAANPEDEGQAGVPNTEMYFRMSVNQSNILSQGITDLIRESELERLLLLTQALEFKSAQLSCAKGSVGALEIVKVADSDRGNVIGFGFYDLIYTCDSGDETVLHSVANIECYVPFMEEEQFEWLRTMVGGNHQYTSSIKIKLTGFDLEQIRTDFMEKLAAHAHDHTH